MPIYDQVVDTGALVIVCYFFIRAFFDYLKSRKIMSNSNTDLQNNNASKGNELSVAILDELKLMNGNHLHTIQKCMEDNNRCLTETIHDDNTKMIEILGRIEGILSVRK